MAKDRDPLLFIRLLQSPPGQEAINAFLNSWDSDHDLGRALGAAQQVLESRGVWEHYFICRRFKGHSGNSYA
jgi:hypothetical protein